MDLKLNDIDNSNKELEAMLTYEELAPHFDKAIDKYKKNVNIPGFRKGKAPLNMIKKLYGEGIEHSALEDIVNEIFLKYLVDNKIDILGQGSVSDIDYKPKENLKFKVKFEILPELKLEDYKGIELKKTKYLIDDTLVEDEIRYHRFRNATTEIDGIASDDNYNITVDFQDLDELGNILVGQSQKDLKVYLGNPEIFPEFKEAFRGIREGETKIIDSKNADGENKKVQITCKKIEKIVLPEMSEEFFKKITGKENMNTEEEFRTEIKKELQKIYDDIAIRKMRNDVVSEMVKLNDVSVPDKFVNSVLDSMVEEFKHQYPKQQLPENFNIEEFKKAKRVDAILTTKWYLIRDKLIETNKLKVEEGDYKKIAEQNFARYNIPVDKLLEAYKDNEEVKLKILNDKVMDLIISNAKVEEIEEITKTINND